MGEVVTIARYSQGKRRRKLFTAYNKIDRSLSICGDLMSNMDILLQEEDDGVAKDMQKNMSKVEKEVLQERISCIENYATALKKRLLGERPLR